MKNDYSSLVAKIISDQEAIIGSLAVDLAHNVNGLDWSDGIPAVIGDSKNVISDLVKVYSNLFGQSSVAICKDSIDSVDPDLSGEIIGGV